MFSPPWGNSGRQRFLPKCSLAQIGTFFFKNPIEQEELLQTFSLHVVPSDFLSLVFCQSLSPTAC